MFYFILCLATKCRDLSLSCEQPELESRSGKFKKKISEMPSSLGESLLDEGSSVAKVSSLSKIRNSAAKR